MFWKLTRKESLALQAMVRRVGFAPILADLEILASEMEDRQNVAEAIFDARQEAQRTHPFD